LVSIWGGECFSGVHGGHCIAGKNLVFIDIENVVSAFVDVVK
jgi:hypothetical protein